MPIILYREESYRIVGACFEVYNELGSGFLEAVYQETLAMEFHARGIPFAAKRALGLYYKGQRLESTYMPDFICHESIIVEIKSASSIADRHRAQVHNYLKATGHRLGLLVNFGSDPKLEYERIVR
ncbi:MAG: GxxExxY protein [Pirellulaceae bacterium]